MKLRNRCAYLAVFVLVAAFRMPAPALAQEPVHTPAQAAYLNAEIKRAQGRFAQQVAELSGVPANKILAWLPNPNDWRAADPRYAVIPAVERETKTKLTDDQRQQIAVADRDMKTAIAKARVEARKR